MESFGYTPLQEDVSASYSDNIDNASSSQSCSSHEGLTENGIALVDCENPHDGKDLVTKKTTKLKSKSASSPSKSKDAKSPTNPSAKYTPMRPTIVRQLEDNDNHENPDGPEDTSSEPEDLYFYNSEVKINTGDSKTFKKSIKFNVVLCGLLTACVFTVGFGMLYVFVILPSHKGDVLSPGGQAAPYTLKHLGKNEAVTSCGVVRGTFENGAHVFRGIPYADPPIGSHRWKSPKSLNHKSRNCWSGIWNATTYGNVCAQPLIVANGADSDHNTANTNIDTHIVGSEDCLYLNIWTPSIHPSELYPVLVWIHSGDFVYGSGHARGMTPNSELAVDTKAVYVSFNYRLGVFGFLALDALREKEESPHGATGNYGVMDQQAVLRWVKTNIRHFGGDPQKVTVFGHGSGATSIEALLLSPDSIDLFHAAWLTSPVAILNMTTTVACNTNEYLMTKSGCKDATCLRGLDTQTLVNMWPLSQKPQWSLEHLITSLKYTQWRNEMAIIDGYVLHWSSIADGPRGPVVPVVIGTTLSDVPDLHTGKAMHNMTWTDINTFITTKFSPLGAEIVQNITLMYSQGPNTSSETSTPSTHSELFSLPSRQYARLIRDIQMVCPAKLVADGITAMYINSAPVYLYVAEAYPSHILNLIEEKDKLAPNSLETDSLFVGWDMVAFFGTFKEFGFFPRQKDISFQGIVRQELLSLAKQGKPNAARWHTEKINTGILRSEVTVSPAPTDYYDNCDIFKNSGFFRYNWSKK